MPPTVRPYPQVRKFLNASYLAGSHFDTLLNQGGHSAAVVRSARQRLPRASYAGPGGSASDDLSQALASARRGRASNAGSARGVRGSGELSPSLASGRQERGFNAGSALGTRGSTDLSQSLASGRLERGSNAASLLSTRASASEASVALAAAGGRFERASYAGHAASPAPGSGAGGVGGGASRFDRASYTGTPTKSGDGASRSEPLRHRQSGTASAGGSDDGTTPGAAAAAAAGSGEGTPRAQRQAKVNALNLASTGGSVRKAASSTGAGAASALGSALRQSSGPGQHLVLPKI